MAARSNGGLAQLGEHLPCKQGVESSNLLVSTIAMSSADRKEEAVCACTETDGFLPVYSAKHVMK